MPIAVWRSIQSGLQEVIIGISDSELDALVARRQTELDELEVVTQIRD